MSGGSYSYLCFANDLGELREKERDIQRMADRLAKLGYAADAARETMDTLLELRAAENRIMARVDRLKTVWQTVEWWDSCDSGEDEVKKALDKYRGINSALSEG